MFQLEHNDSTGELLSLQFLEPLRQELPLWFLLRQRQRLLIRRPSLRCPAEPEVQAIRPATICPAGRVARDNLSKCALGCSPQCLESVT